MSLSNKNVSGVERTAGPGGHITYEVETRTSAGELHYYEFTGNLFGGPVAMSSTSPDGNTSTEVVSEPRRFGEFATERWVYAFFDFVNRGRQLAC